MPRLATLDDVPALEKLIPASVRSLQSPWYAPAQMEAALGPVFAVDRQIIRDGTYFVIEQDNQIIACGGWSKRPSLYGGDAGRSEDDRFLDPARDAARVRAFFVDPAWARRSLGRALLDACEAAMQKAGFATAEMVATLAGEPLYAFAGYEVASREEIPLRDGITLPTVLMAKRFPQKPRVI